MLFTPPAFLKKSGPTVTYITSVDSTTDAQDYTFSNTNIGTASADRYVVVCVGIRASFTAPTLTVTVGGAACTQVIRSSTTGNGFPSIFMTSAPFTSGTTADIIVDGTQNSVNCGISVYTITGLTSATAVDTDDTATDGATITLNSLTAGSVVIGCSTTTTAANTVTMTNLTEDSDRVIESGSLNMAAGHATTTSTGNYAVVFDWVNATNMRAVVAAWF